MSQRGGPRGGLAGELPVAELVAEPVEAVETPAPECSSAHGLFDRLNDRKPSDGLQGGNPSGEALRGGLAG